ncbi:MAG: DUF4097 family beta strand repeat-containing protein [bacterium]|nr:DUF4097 family beta strand repeat-containing protein [bacterium]
MIRSLVIKEGFARAWRRAALLAACAALLCGFLPIDATAQRKFSRTYPASQNVRLQLLNRTGTVTVEGWNRNEVSISAYLEAPAATLEPQSLSGTIYINLVKDNQGRGDVGNVNFTIRVPFASSVDIETKMGNLSVTNVRGGLVRAHITTEGDITLTNIGAGAVTAQNGIGDIFYDGTLQSGGGYRFFSISGTISLRIPPGSSFKLLATAPSTRNISLGTFSENMRYTWDGRRVVGTAGDGAATLSVTNQRGNIQFFRQ